MSFLLVRPTPLLKLESYPLYVLPAMSWSKTQKYFENKLKKITCQLSLPSLSQNGKKKYNLVLDTDDENSCTEVNHYVINRTKWKKKLHVTLHNFVRWCFLRRCTLNQFYWDQFHSATKYAYMDAWTQATNIHRNCNEGHSWSLNLSATDFFSNFSTFCI